MNHSPRKHATDESGAKHSKLGMLALVLWVIVPLAMAPKPKPTKIKIGPVTPKGDQRCISRFCGGWVKNQSVEHGDDPGRPAAAALDLHRQRDHREPERR